ncbi:MAG: hypothetical protein J6O50_09475 [Ruminiclostridium sp.]|nr:hypothetical protein [Ruminiclostridium sp.]
MTDAKQKKIADKEEIMEFLTNVMRSSEVGEKDRIGAAFRLGRYLGLEGKDSERESLPQVIIYDGTKQDKLP